MSNNEGCIYCLLLKDSIVQCDVCKTYYKKECSQCKRLETLLPSGMCYSCNLEKDMCAMSQKVDCNVIWDL